MSEDNITIRLRAEGVDEVASAFKTLSKKVVESVDDMWKKTNEAGNRIRKFIADLNDATKTRINFDGTVESMKSLTQGMKTLGISQTDLNAYMRDNGVVLLENGKFMDKLTGKVIRQAKVLRDATKQARGFKFEWLSIMFAGMALDRAFGGIVRSQLELFGVTDMMSSAWTLVMLPVMEQITPLIYALIDAFMNLPEPVKMAIGWFVLLAAGLGKILTFAGQAFLGFQGLIRLFPSIGTAIANAGGGITGLGKVIGAFFGGLSATVLAVIAAIVLVVIGMYLAFKENFMGMKGIVTDFIDGFKQAFKGLIDVFKGVMNIIKGIFSGDGDLIVKGFTQIIKGLFNTVVGLIKMTLTAVGAIVVGTIRVVIGILQGTVNAFIAAYDKISKFFGGSGTTFRLDVLSKMSAPSLAKGGAIDQTGMYMLHAGEFVYPRNDSANSANNAPNGQLTFAPNVTIQATVSKDIDINTLATKMNRVWATELEKLLKSRGSI
jgi:hypothetical protein